MLNNQRRRQYTERERRLIAHMFHSILLDIVIAVGTIIGGLALEFSFNESGILAIAVLVCAHVLAHPVFLAKIEMLRTYGLAFECRIFIGPAPVMAAGGA